MRFADRAGLTAGVVAAALVLAGCGSSGNGTLLTEGAATQLTSELTQASRALDDYNCNVAYTAIAEYKDDVNQLVGVNATLVRMLSEGGSRISTLANQSCPSGVSPDTSTSTSAGPTTSGTTTGATVTTTSSATTTTTTSESDTGSGGAAPTTGTSPSVVSTPTTTSTPATTGTTDNSGGAGLGGSAGNTGGGATGGGTAQ